MYFNPVKPLIQSMEKVFLTNVPTKNQRNDEDIDCIQFGICSIQTKSPRSEELFFR